MFGSKKRKFQKLGLFQGGLEEGRQGREEEREEEVMTHPLGRCRSIQCATCYPAMSTEFKVGQVVYGDDFARLPVGSKIQSLAAFPAHFTKVSSGNAWAYTDGAGKTDSPASLDVGGPGRTLIYLPKPEDTDDVEPEPAPTTCDGGYKCRAETHVDGCLVDDVEPEPLKVGDAVLVWATVDHVFSDGTPRVDIHNRTSAPPALTIVEPDAIVRPSAGQVPPWVRVATERVAMIAKTLMAEGGMDHDAAFKTAESLDRAGVRVTEGGAS